MADPCDSIIRILRDHNSRLDKESIIEVQALEKNSEFFEGCKLAYDKMITFGVKKIPSHGGPDGQGLPWVAFLELTHLLRTRRLTGNDAISAIELALSASTKSQWNDWYKLILQKDLRCGISEVTINKIVNKINKDYTINTFSCMLAHDGANHESKITGKKLVEPKLDGCLSEDWVVEFENGSKVRIKEVVDNQIAGKVKSFNTITGKIEFNSITGWAVDGVDDAVKEYEWFELTLENGSKLPPLTGNHLIYLPLLKCYRRVDELTEDDVLLCDVSPSSFGFDA
jgi:hypothetical protein